MALLTFQNIMDAQDITEREIPIPEWGGEVMVRSVNYRQMSALKEKAKAMKEAGMEVDEDFVEKHMVQKGLVAPSVTIEEVEVMWDKSASAMMKLLTGILGASKGSEEDQKEAEKSVSTGPEQDVPVQSGGEAGEDSSGTPDGDGASSIPL
jgi:hypothetical protein